MSRACPFGMSSLHVHAKRTQPRRPDQRRGAMTDREVEAISDFLRHFGSFGCRQISVRRTEPKPRTPEDVGRVVLESLAAWRAEGLDAERLYKVATIAIHFEAYKLPGPICMPACCRPWGALEPACPPGPGRPLTGAQLQQALLRAVPIGPPPAPDAPLPDDLEEDLERTGLAPEGEGGVGGDQTGLGIILTWG